MTMPRRASLALAATGLLALLACSRSTPGADSSAASAVADTTSAAVPAPVPPTTVDTTPAVADTVPPSSPAAPRPATGTPPPSRAVGRDTAGRDTGRAGLTPRPPHPVPRPMPRGDSTEPRLSAGDTDEAMIERLRREAKALAHVAGCTAADQCALLPLGQRACGGPEEYIAYCPRTTDVPALKRKADELARAERAYNTKNGLASSCEMRQPPTVTLVGGSCRAAP